MRVTMHDSPGSDGGCGAVETYGAEAVEGGGVRI